MKITSITMMSTCTGLLLVVFLYAISTCSALSSANTKPNKIFWDIQRSTKDEIFYRIYMDPLKEPSTARSRTASNGRKTQQRRKSPRVLEYEERVEKRHFEKSTLLKIDSIDDADDLIQLIYEDDFLVVVNKPAGMLCVPDIEKQSISLLQVVHHKYGSAATAENPSCMIVNRLDMSTSGLVVFGKTPDVTLRLNEIFRDRQVQKEYEAIVCGHFNTADNNASVISSGIIDLPIQRDVDYPPFMRVATPESQEASLLLMEDLRACGYKKQGRKKPKPSQTEFHVLEQSYLEDNLAITRLRLKPLTGRTHQLRVHCAALGLPILGDPTYGAFGPAAPQGGLQNAITVTENDVLLQRETASIELQGALCKIHPPNVKSMSLHAASLSLQHPVTGEQMCWQADVPF